MKFTIPKERVIWGFEGLEVWSKPSNQPSRIYKKNSGSCSKRGTRPENLRER
jgi:hypothetical protein